MVANQRGSTIYFEFGFFPYQQPGRLLYFFDGLGELKFELANFAVCKSKIHLKVTCRNAHAAKIVARTCHSRCLSNEVVRSNQTEFCNAVFALEIPFFF